MCRSPIDVPKIVRVMKLTGFLLFVALLQVSAANYAQTTKLTLTGRSVTLEEIFGKIEAQSEFSIFYNLQQVDLGKRVDVDFENALIDKVLNTVLAGTNLTWTVNNRLIVVHKKDEVISPVHGAQPGAVTGRITDRNGSPLPGVTVVVKGTTVGTISSNDGTYALANVSPSTTLIFSFVGMRSQEIVVGNQTTINVVMAEETIGIEEVVAIGYGTQKKSSITGAISSVEAEDVVSMPVTNLSNALSGRIKGCICQPGFWGTRVMGPIFGSGRLIPGKVPG
jgi:TonB-dependent starch-binding outer membrane protein SusC